MQAASGLGAGSSLAMLVASDASLLPLFQSAVGMNTSQSSPSTAFRLTPSGGLEANLVSRWTGE